MDTFDDWALTLAVFLPLVGAVVMLLVPRARGGCHKVIALVTTLATLGVGVYLLVDFDYDDADGASSSTVDKPWIDVINSRYHVGIDGISLPLLLLSMLITVLVRHLLAGTTSPSRTTPRRSSS